MRFGGVGWGGWCWRWGWGHQPWEEHQRNAQVLGVVCIIPNLSGRGFTSPLGFRFISTDEGLAGSCRLRMRIKERSTAAPPSSQHPRGPRVGGPHRYPPRDSAQPKSRSNTQSVRHPAPRSLVCLLLLLPLSSL